MSSIVYGQIKIDYLFRDLCTDSIIECSYQLFRPQSSKVYTSNGKHIQLDSFGLFIFTLIYKRGNYDVLSTDNKFYKLKHNYIDTIEIPRLIKKALAIHESEISFCYCNTLANGSIIDYHYNGCVRMQGTFNNGVPTSNVRIYNYDGKLIEEQVFRNGNYVKTRFFRAFWKS
jgi:hypothetical protein